MSGRHACRRVLRRTLAVRSSALPNLVVRFKTVTPDGPLFQFVEEFAVSQEVHWEMIRRRSTDDHRCKRIAWERAVRSRVHALYQATTRPQPRLTKPGEIRRCAGLRDLGHQRIAAPAKAPRPAKDFLGYRRIGHVRQPSRRIRRRPPNSTTAAIASAPLRTGTGWTTARRRRADPAKLLSEGRRDSIHIN